MRLADVLDLARAERLYPALILHGATPEARLAAALELVRALLCAAAPADRPCGECAHCRRIAWPPVGDGAFHPDLHVLERDRTTVTSVEATKQFLRGAQIAPFEARGQAFIIASADTLSGEAANALLKTLEEPHERAPRHFFLLAPSRFDLLQTLRSRSLELFLGTAERPAAAAVEPIAEAFAAAVGRWRTDRDASYLLVAASVLEKAGDFKDPRATRPWAVAAAAVRDAADRSDGDRRPHLDLALELLDAPQARVRGIPARRILEGLTVRCFAAANRHAP